MGQTRAVKLKLRKSPMRRPVMGWRYHYRMPQTWFIVSHTFKPSQTGGWFVLQGRSSVETDAPHVGRVKFMPAAEEIKRFIQENQLLEEWNDLTDSELC